MCMTMLQHEQVVISHGKILSVSLDDTTSDSSSFHQTLEGRFDRKQDRPEAIPSNVIRIHVHQSIQSSLKQVPLLIQKCFHLVS